MAICDACALTQAIGTGWVCRPRGSRRFCRSRRRAPSLAPWGCRACGNGETGASGASRASAPPTFLPTRVRCTRRLASGQVRDKPWNANAPRACVPAAPATCVQGAANLRWDHVGEPPPSIAYMVVCNLYAERVWATACVSPQRYAQVFVMRAHSRRLSGLAGSAGREAAAVSAVRGGSRLRSHPGAAEHAGVERLVQAGRAPLQHSCRPV